MSESKKIVPVSFEDPFICSQEIARAKISQQHIHGKNFQDYPEW